MQRHELHYQTRYAEIDITSWKLIYIGSTILVVILSKPKFLPTLGSKNQKVNK